MKSRIAILLSLALALLVAAPTPRSLARESGGALRLDGAGGQKKDKGSEPAPSPDEAKKQLTKLMREIGFDLEGGSSRSFLQRINQSKFDDYPHFEDNVERLMREDSIRINLRVAFTAPPTADGLAQVAADADMELAKKDSNAAPQRRKQQLTFDFEWTNRGWQIDNISPRSFFNP
jgi:hypothetical protein